MKDELINKMLAYDAVVFHDSDLDGFMSAMIVGYIEKLEKEYPTILYIPVRDPFEGYDGYTVSEIKSFFDDNLSKFKANQTIYVLDLPIHIGTKPECNLFVVDHHKSNIDKYKHQHIFSIEDNNSLTDDVWIDDRSKWSEKYRVITDTSWNTSTVRLMNILYNKMCHRYNRKDTLNMRLGVIGSMCDILTPIPKENHCLATDGIDLAQPWNDMNVIAMSTLFSIFTRGSDVEMDSAIKHLPDIMKSYNTPSSDWDNMGGIGEYSILCEDIIHQYPHDIPKLINNTTCGTMANNFRLMKIFNIVGQLSAVYGSYDLATDDIWNKLLPVTMDYFNKLVDQGIKCITDDRISVPSSDIISEEVISMPLIEVVLNPRDENGIHTRIGKLACIYAVDGYMNSDVHDMDMNVDEYFVYIKAAMGDKYGMLHIPYVRRDNPTMRDMLNDFWIREIEQTSKVTHTPIYGSSRCKYMTDDVIKSIKDNIKLV